LIASRDIEKLSAMKHVGAGGVSQYIALIGLQANCCLLCVHVWVKRAT
jgi:hypothetical protein